MLTVMCEIGETPPQSKRQLCCQRKRIKQSEIKFIECRINFVKNHFGCLCHHLAAYIRASGQLRDKGDDLAKLIMLCGDSENLNFTMKSSMLQFAALLGKVQDARHARICLLEEKVLPILTKYEEICKYAKDGVKHAVKCKTKKTKLRQKLSMLKIKRFRRNQLQISKEEDRLGQVALEASRCMQALKCLILQFEDQKLCDIRRLFTSFIRTEMLFHAKALETYGMAWKAGTHINIESDMTELLQYMHKQSSHWKMQSDGTTNGDETQNPINYKMEMKSCLSDECFKNFPQRKKKRSTQDCSNLEKIDPCKHLYLDQLYKPDAAKTLFSSNPCRNIIDDDDDEWLDIDTDDIVKAICDDVASS